MRLQSSTATKMSAWMLAALTAVTVLGARPASAASTLETIRERGHIVCGVAENSAGFSQVDSSGRWWGLDAEFCSALAAAVFGKRDAVKYRPLSAQDRFRALAAGEVDVLSRATTWTLSRDTELGVLFAGVLFYDGQGFLVRRGSALSSVLELSGASICALTGSSAERGLSDFFKANEMRYQLVSASRWDDLVKAYAAESCSLITGDISLLSFERSRLDSPNDHVLLPEIVLKEPMGPAVRRGDDQWFSVVRWTLMALINAEELGITSENAEEQRGSPIIAVRQFFGLEGNLGQGLELAADWAYQIVRQVGNYGEIFERNLGQKSTFKLDRGFNDLWTRGGLMYSYPFR